MPVDWYAPQARIQVAEKGRTPFFVAQDRIMRVSYSEPHRGATEMAATLNNSDGELWYVEPYLRKGSKINLEFGYPERMRGPIPLVSMGLPSGGDELEIKARCKADSASDKVKLRTWTNVAVTEVVEQLANERGYFGANVLIDFDFEKRESISQYRQTDHEFLHWLADLTGRAFWVDEDGWHFEIPDKDKEPTAILRHVAGAFGPGVIESFRAPKIRKRTLRKLKLTARDPLRGKTIEHEIDVTDSSLPVLSGDPIASTDEDTEASDRGVSYSDAALYNEAIGRMREEKLGAVRMELTVHGDPFVRKGKRVLVTDLHEMLDGLWFTRDVKHEISDGYYTSVTLGREGHAKRKRKTPGQEKPVESEWQRIAKYGRAAYTTASRGVKGAVKEYIP